MQIKTTVRYVTSHLSEWLPSVNQQTSPGEEKGNPCALLVGIQIGAATVEELRNYLKKLKMELPYDPEIPLL